MRKRMRTTGSSDREKWETAMVLARWSRSMNPWWVKITPAAEYKYSESSGELQKFVKGCLATSNHVGSWSQLNGNAPRLT